MHVYSLLKAINSARNFIIFHEGENKKFPLHLYRWLRSSIYIAVRTKTPKNLFYCSVQYTQRNINSSEKSTSVRWSPPQRYQNRICKYGSEQKLNDSPRKINENKINTTETYVIEQTTELLNEIKMLWEMEAHTEEKERPKILIFSLN